MRRRKGRRTSQRMFKDWDFDMGGIELGLTMEDIVEELNHLGPRPLQASSDEVSLETDAGTYRPRRVA